MDTTIERAIEDYRNGFYTTKDADSGDILVGTCCDICRDEFFQVKTEDMVLADSMCQNCKDTFILHMKRYRSMTSDQFVEDFFGMKLL